MGDAHADKIYDLAAWIKYVTLFDMKKSNGFTLIELSIVLVVIGLVIGGVMVGQDVIRNAKIQSVMADVERFKTAADTFEEKYGVLPGDMSTAASVWSSCIDHASVADNDCNGDGDGQIETSGSQQYEPVRFWQHLQLAGLVEGSYNGNQVVSTANDDIYPKNAVQDYWQSYTVPSGTTFTDRAAGTSTKPAGNVFESGLTSTNLRESEIYKIDRKSDDALPFTGWVTLIVTNGASSGCLTATNAYDADDSGAMANCEPTFYWRQ